MTLPTVSTSDPLLPTVPPQNGPSVHHAFRTIPHLTIPPKNRPFLQCPPNDQPSLQHPLGLTLPTVSPSGLTLSSVPFRTDPSYSFPIRTEPPHSKPLGTSLPIVSHKGQPSHIGPTQDWQILQHSHAFTLYMFLFFLYKDLIVVRQSGRTLVTLLDWVSLVQTKNEISCLQHVPKKQYLYETFCFITF